MEYLAKDKISQYLSAEHQTIVDDILIFEQLDSTNSYLIELAAKEPVKQKICLAESQTAGRGRLGRNWFSPSGSNIYLSILWTFNKNSQELSGLSLAVGIAVIKALCRYGINADIGLKWPNDVLWQHKKLAGILLETAKVANKIVIGVGLNLAMPTNAEQEISQAWTDLSQIIDAVPDRNKITGLLIDEILTAIETFDEQGLPAFFDEWQKYDLIVGKKVSIFYDNKKILGYAQGINKDGNLLVKDEFNHVQVFAGGEVSLRLC